MPSPPNVVFVVVDTLRRDRVGCYGYDRPTTPAIDEFAAGATRYADPVSQASWSVPAHASLFTGQYPEEHGATCLRPVLRSRNTLPTLLHEAGYDTYAVSPNEYVRPATGFGGGFDEFRTPDRFTLSPRVADVLGRGINAITSSRYARRPVEAAFNAVQSGERERVEMVDEAIELVREARAPYFLFVNLIGAHLPRSPKPHFVDKLVDADVDQSNLPRTERDHNFAGGELTADQRRALSQLYDADVATVDESFGKLLQALREQDALRDSLVVVVSDHGENLGEFGLIGHQHSVYDSVVSVPLLISYPGQTDARIVDGQVETRRVFHTVLDVAGVRSNDPLSLKTGAPSERAYGSFYSPMVNVTELERRRRASYERRLFDEPLTFVRGREHKLIEYDGERRLYRTPEQPAAQLTVEESHDIDRWLRG